MEVYYNGVWGTVCHDHWGVADANVVCRELGYAHAIAFPDYSAFGIGTGQVGDPTKAHHSCMYIREDLEHFASPPPSHFTHKHTSHTHLTHSQIWLTGVECVGTETSLYECPHDTWGEVGSCSHVSDAAVICTNVPVNPFPVRLADGEP